MTDAASLGLLAILALLLVKEAGVPIPVPGDLIVIGAGVSAAAGGLEPVTTIVAIVVATIVGGMVQFLLLRGAARGPLLRLLARFGVPQERLEAYAGALRRRGLMGVAAARMTPGVRIGAIAGSAIAGLALVPFLVGLAIGNAVFAGGHFVLGMAVGRPAIDFVAGSAGLLAAVAIGLAVVGVVGWLAIDRVRRRRASRDALASLGAWADAACPACLALGVLGREREPGGPGR